MYIYQHIYRGYIAPSLLTFFLSITLSTSLAQTTYYVASNGNDSNTGLSTTSPLQTLVKVNSLSLKPGDQVLFRRGDTFQGTLTIRQSGSTSSPIIVDAYGNGDKPILAGSVPLTSWTSLGGGIYQAACAACGSSVTGVYNNNTSLPLGRYPNSNTLNKGYLTIRAHTDKYQIFSQEHLPDGIDWKGAEVVMRSTQWVIDRAVIDHQYGDVLNLFNYSNYSPADGWGYFIQNHPATLDQDGEWYYNNTNKTVQLFSKKKDPNSQFITATVQSRVLDIANSSNISIQNLHITQALNQNVWTTNVSSFSFINNDVTNAGEDGITVNGTGANFLLENNRVLDVNNNGIWIDALKSVTLRGNSIRRVGIVPGRGKSGDGQYNGVQSSANQNVLIEHNIIDSVGYNGMTFWNNTTIQQNIISNYCMTKSDGGGLYVWNRTKVPMTNIHLVSNIVFNGIGAPEGSFKQGYSGANGIFLDDCVENIELTNNTVFNNHQWGFFLHATSNLILNGNTSFDNGNSQFVLSHNGGYCAPRNNTIKNNIFMSKLLSQGVAQYESIGNDLTQYGRIDSNSYARPFNDGGVILAVVNTNQGNSLGLDEWKTFSKGLDVHSSRSPVTYKQYKNEGSGGTNRFTNTFEKTNEQWELIYSRYSNAEVTQDSSNKLDGGSLRVSFLTPSGQSGSYAQAVKRIGSIKKGQTYVLRFDGIANVNVDVLVYLRQYGAPYKEYDKRYGASLTPTRRSFEFPFTASDDESDAVILVQIDGEGPTFWLDNVRLQEAVPIQNNPDDFIKLFYNPTLKDSLISLMGNYRDVKNQLYSNSIIIKPFSSLILLKDTLPVQPADLSLWMESAERVLQVNQPTQVRLHVVNRSNAQAALSRWTCRLPANLEFVDTNGQPYSDNVLTGTVAELTSMGDTVFSFLVRATVAGRYRLSAQLTTATSPDPDSSPNSGTADGEDDAAMVELRVGENAISLFESPNPNQRLLPSVVSNQPTPDPNQGNLRFRMELNSRTPKVGQLITCTFYVTNIGGETAQNVKIMNVLPTNFELQDSTVWNGDGRSVSFTIPTISANTTASASFQARVISSGLWINRAKIISSSTDTTNAPPKEGYTNPDNIYIQADGRSQ